MSDGQRARRPDPQRSEPIRGGWLSLFGPLTGASDAGAARDPRDPIARAVELGYRVVDDYIRQGEAMAKRINERGITGAGVSGDLQDLASRWFQYVSELSELWFRMVGLASVGQAALGGTPGVPDPPTGDAPARPRGSTAAPGQGPRVTVAVECARPVEVTLDLRSGSWPAGLRAHDLRAADPEKPRLASPTIGRPTEDGSIALRVCVPEDQPTGLYSGLLLDEATSLPVGSLSLRIQ